VAFKGEMLRIASRLAQSGLVVVALAACGEASDDAMPEGAGGEAGTSPTQASGGVAAGGGSGSGSGTGPQAGSAGTTAEPGEAGAAGMAGSAPQGPALSLQVMTFNTPNYPTALAAQDIANAGADVVGLQEVTPADTAEIATALGPEWRFVQEDRVNTFALVSRLPILQRIGVTSDTRGGIGATIEVEPGVRVHLFTTHGMWTPYGPYQLGIDGMSLDAVLASEETVRMPALLELLELAKPYIESREPTFLTGDFNAPSHLDYEPPVPWPTSLAPKQAGLVDSYAELNPDNAKKSACEFAIDDPGITWTQLADAEPNGCFDRIDFVYYSSDDARPVQSAVIDVQASDHRAVLTTFEVRAPARAAKTQNPLPPSGAQQVSRHALLTWVPALDATSEQLFLGEGAADTPEAASTATRHLTRLLAPGTTYTWRVDSTTNQDSVTGDTWTFTTRVSGGLEPDQLSYTAGATITVQFDGADAAGDWIGLYPRSSAYGPGSPAPTWKYLNDSETVPASAIAQGTITLIAPASAGDYVLRFFDNDAYDVEDEVGLSVE
jgi:endonuclease/exonuclease/phosphatase family metal-dependent hydrolase